MKNKMQSIAISKMPYIILMSKKKRNIKDNKQAIEHLFWTIQKRKQIAIEVHKIPIICMCE